MHEKERHNVLVNDCILLIREMKMVLRFQKCFVLHHCKEVLRTFHLIVV